MGMKWNSTRGFKGTTPAFAFSPGKTKENLGRVVDPGVLRQSAIKLILNIQKRP